MDHKSIVDKLGIRPAPWEAIGFEFETIESIKEWLSQTVDNTVNHGDSSELYYVVYSGDSTEEDPIFTAITANGPTSEKHAQLIAAAPEMLEALGNIINAMYDKDSTLANLNGHICNAKDMLISKFPEIKELLK